MNISPSDSHLDDPAPPPVIHLCRRCGDDMHGQRYALGYRTCLPCGETLARERKHTIVPMPKSNYIVVTDHTLLHNLNSSHKGGR